MKIRMGTFYTNGRVENHVDRKKSAEVNKMLVDSGAEFTWINGETLKSIGVKREKKKGMNPRVDSRAKKLVAGGPILAA